MILDIYGPVIHGEALTKLVIPPGLWELSTALSYGWNTGLLGLLEAGMEEGHWPRENQRIRLNKHFFSGLLRDRGVPPTL
eukprot:s1204_g8.t1